MENLFFQKNPLQDFLSSLNALISTKPVLYLKILQTTTTLDIDTDWTDELGANLEEELEECDEYGSSEVHPFKMSRCSIEEHNILKG